MPPMLALAPGSGRTGPWADIGVQLFLRHACLRGGQSRSSALTSRRRFMRERSQAYATVQRLQVPFQRCRCRAITGMRAGLQSFRMLAISSFDSGNTTTSGRPYTSVTACLRRDCDAPRTDCGDSAVCCRSCRESDTTVAAIVWSLGFSNVSILFLCPVPLPLQGERLKPWQIGERYCFSLRHLRILPNSALAMRQSAPLPGVQQACSSKACLIMHWPVWLIGENWRTSG